MGMIKRSVFLTVAVSGLGYFVDIYDLLLFGIVRVPSLKALGVSDSDMLSVGIHLLNMQMAGMLVGGIIWGIWGDRRGRKSVLFGSILLYSIANVANAFVTSPEVYAWLRLFAGIGLAGELGAAVTLVSEVMDVESRGYGTTVIASIGILGAVVASLVGDYFSWKIAYLVGGGMGLCLLALRAGLLESGMFDSMKDLDISRGHFYRLFTKPDWFFRYANCILIGLPIWFCIGIMVTFAPEFARELGVQGAVTGSKSIMWCYAGSSFGDFSAGVVSQWLKSRKKAIALYMLMLFVLLLVYVTQRGWSVDAFYGLCVALGLGAGYWAVFVTNAAEQFGTNIRATVTTTVPNFVRGSVVPVTLTFQMLKDHVGMLPAVFSVGLAVMILAAVSLYFLPETYGKDLDYLETAE